MSAHRRCPRMNAQDLGKSPLDHMLDFGGPESDGDLSPEAAQRLRQVIKKIEEMSERIDRLCNDSD